MTPLVLNKAQSLGVEHLMAHERAILLAGLGVGKTITVLKAFNGLRLLGDAQTLLVVAPIRVVNLTWPNEIADWPEFRHLRVANLRTREGWQAWLNSDADVYLANWEMLPKLCAFPTVPDIVCFDELTKAKNPKSKRVAAFREALPPHVRRWGMTATPTPNGYLQLFAQVRLIDDGKRLGPSFDQYKRTYFHPVDYMEYDWRLNEGAAEVIQSRIAGICLTLLSEDYGIKVPVNEEFVEVPLPEHAEELYETMEKELVVSLGDDPNDVIVSSGAGVLVGKLLQICSGAAYREDKTVVELHDAKTEALKSYLKDRGPALVVYNYRHELDRLKKALPKAYAFEDAVNEKLQAEIAAKWNAGKIPQLLVHPASAGHGLNLQFGGCDVVWFSPTYDRELYDQLNGRVARQGQKNTVTVAHLICPGTIDEAVVETLSHKHNEQRSLLIALRNLRNLHQ